jgi:hypothetical protein
MDLEARLREDLKAAMRAGDVTTRETLRSLIAALKNRRIELGRDLDEGEALAVLGKSVKSREDSAAQYDAAKRPELAQTERAEIAVIQRYLPRQLGEDETRELVRAKAAALGVSSKKDLGQVMKAVMAEHRGQVDGKLVQRLAAEILE